MTTEKFRKILWIGGTLLTVWIGVRYLLPVAVPFLIGGSIALLAEPGVSLLQRRMKWKRLPAVGLCVSLTLLLLTALMSVTVAAAIRELGMAAKMAPKVGQTVGQGLVVLEDWLVSLADRAPDPVRPVLLQTVMDTFQDGSALISQVTQRVPGAVAGFIGWLSQGALAVGTGVLAGFMISARLPKLRSWLQKQLPASWSGKAIPALKSLKKTFGGWLRAQCKLMAVTWAVVSAGFLLLGIPYGVLWAALVALVDAVPVLGVGTVLVPWAVVCFLQGSTLQGVGLLATWAAAWLTRTVLEPRLVGKSIGLDPLLSLVAFYVGFQLWGIVGMVLAPMAAALLQSFKNNL